MANCRIPAVPTLTSLGILLLSACGLNHVPPAAAPNTPNREFIVWRQGSDDAERVLGTGRIFGFPEKLGAYLHLTYPACAASDFTLSGSRLPGTSSAQLSNGFSLTMDIALPSASAPTFDPMPATGMLHLRRRCPVGTDLVFQAEAPPELSGTWRTNSAGQNPPLQVSEEFLTTRSSALVHLSSLTLTGAACFATGTAALTGSVELLSQSFTRTYQLPNGSTLLAESPLGPLRSKPFVALQTRYTIQGGACDGRTASVMLHRA